MSTVAERQLYIIIPALNEEKTIGKVVSKLKSITDKILVVDDGSTDNTGKLATEMGAIVLRHTTPQGYDASISHGINEAFKLGAYAAITCDADGQHQLQDVSRISQPVMENKVHFCAGVRKEYNRLIEGIIGFFAQFVYKTNDPFCGLKCYHHELFEAFGPFPKKLFVGTLPLVWVSIKNGKFTALFLPIETTKRLDKPRFGSTVRASYKLANAFGGSLFAFMKMKTGT